MSGTADGGNAKKAETFPTGDGEAFTRSSVGGLHWVKLAVKACDRLVGIPKLKAALVAGNTSCTFNASATLTGTVNTGDTFTIAAESGSPVHTVTGGPYTAAANECGPLTFTPGIATGGAAINALIQDPGTYVYRLGADAREAVLIGSHAFSVRF